jgi:hypothetical protein
MELLASQEEAYQAYKRAYPTIDFWKSDTGTTWRTVGYYKDGNQAKPVTLCYIDYEGNQYKPTKAGRRSTKYVGNVWDGIYTSMPD